MAASVFIFTSYEKIDMHGVSLHASEPNGTIHVDGEMGGAYSGPLEVVGVNVVMQDMDANNESLGPNQYLEDQSV